MEKLKVVNIGSDAIEFENGVKLYSNHDSDCCESHELTLSDLTIADFEGLEFDFIWSSPPCQSHSKVRMMASKSGSYDAVMPDMRLWAEITFLQNFTKNTDIKFVVENVKPYYEPFVKPTAKLGRHLFWANFEIPETEIKDGLTHNERGSSEKGYFDLREYKTKHRKDQIIRNCVDPNVGQYVLGCAVS